MADGNGGCCIARWGGGGHVAAASAGYNTSKMDMIMLKFRPIAPKPITGITSASEGSGGGGGGSGSGRQAKAGGRGRKKANTKDSNNNNNNNINSNNNSGSSSTRRCNNNNNGRKRKSSSPDRSHDLDLVINERDDDHKTGLTLLPLFPEAPDLSSGGSDQVHNDNNVPFSMLNFDSFSSSSPTFEGNYNNCHHHQVSWW